MNQNLEVLIPKNENISVVVPTQTNKEIYVIGDVHGCYHTLLALMGKIPQNSRVIFVGDLVDKGKYSKEIVEFVIQNNYEVILGNHEYLMYNYIREVLFKNNFSSSWYKNKGYGGDLTTQSYKNHLDILIKHLSWIELLPRYIEIDNYFITHGFGLPYYKRKDEPSSKHPLFSNRIDDNCYKHDWEDYENYDVINIFGHCVFKDVLVGKNYYGIDTGCVYGNKLTAIQLGSMRVIEQKVLDIDLERSIIEKKEKLLSADLTQFANLCYNATKE